MRIAIAGGGYAGLSVAAHLHRYTTVPLEIDICESTAGIGNGPAYTWRNPVHVLNGEAAHLSLFEEEPDAFAEWLRELPEAAPFLRDDLPIRNQFVPRYLFADYTRQMFAAACRDESLCTIRVHLRTEIADVEQTEDGVTIALENGERRHVDRLVLATGNPPPRRLFDDVEGAVCIENPWEPEWVRRIPSGPVVMAGTGQTMIDAAVALRAAGHDGVIHAVSRRGVVPETHVYGLNARPVDGARFPSTMRGMTRFVREEVRAAQAENVDWRTVTNAVRPLSCEAWPDLPAAEQRRFFRHIAPYWWGYRQRVAPQVGASFQSLIDEGRVVVQRGRLVRIEPNGDGVHAIVAGAGGETHIAVRTLVNCTGPDLDLHHGPNALLRNVLARGYARSHATGAGLDVTRQLALIDTDGRPSDTLFTLGANTRGAFLETLAIRDIRKQSRALAKTLLRVDVSATRA
jgi:uncharacterized NAD(P)/FAD-binding protein YdhS